MSWMSRAHFVIVLSCVWGAANTSVIAQVSVYPTHRRVDDPVASRPIDLFASSDVEEAILEFLKEPCPFTWSPSTSLSQLSRDLNSRINTVIDFQGIEELGIDASAALVPGGEQFRNGEQVRDQKQAFRSGSKHRATHSQDPTDDPFDTLHRERDDGQSADRNRNRGQPERGTFGNRDAAQDWWSRSGPRVPETRVSVAARMLWLLDQSDLTVEVRHGQLILTTRERAEEHGAVRLYDVTPLVEGRRDPHGSAEAGRPERWQRGTEPLADVIATAIDPETWESLGGPSVIRMFSIRGRRWLVVSASTVTHWKIRSFLETLVP